MRQIHKKSFFTPEQVELLAANKFTAQVNTRRIFFTLEFKNLFLSLYEQGHTSIEIFMECGYNTMPAQLSVSAMQRELIYLRQQVEFLKKLIELACFRRFPQRKGSQGST